MFALCHSIQTGISLTFTAFVAILKKSFENWPFLEQCRLIQQMTGMLHQLIDKA